MTPISPFYLPLSLSPEKPLIYCVPHEIWTTNAPPPPPPTCQPKSDQLCENSLTDFAGLRHELLNSLADGPSVVLAVKVNPRHYGLHFRRLLPLQFLHAVLQGKGAASAVWLYNTCTAHVYNWYVTIIVLLSITLFDLFMIMIIR